MTRASTWQQRRIVALERELSKTFKTSDDGDEQVIKDIFLYWVMATGRNPKRTKLTDDRAKVVRARLKDGYEQDYIKAAIRGLAHKPMVIDGKTYNDLEYLCRKGATLENFASRDNGALCAQCRNPRAVLMHCVDCLTPIEEAA